MTEPAMRLRPLTADDRELLVGATLDNLNWCGERFTWHDMVQTIEFRHYADVLPDRGDFGVVAVDGERVLGLAWALFLGADDPGYGFVDDATPEISVWVAERTRRRGVGRAVTGALIDEAGRRGIGRLSLSAEAENTAARALYTSLGFVPVLGRAVDGVMLCEVPSARGRRPSTDRRDPSTRRLAALACGSGIGGEARRFGGGGEARGVPADP
ncbi:MAG: GNAT family N-acetyltransferase [Gordonia sp. (in: high G+C Gram-positive bacteria)]|uniref:GNAT family N-acetyltransferase n=1 Tax=Gordonia sp. (in: high G+C Gram-positive bacteria) TaxID=84139 RepID=UPI0039E4EF84